MNLQLSSYLRLILPVLTILTVTVTSTACKVDGSSMLESSQNEGYNKSSNTNDWKDITNKGLPEITSDSTRPPTIERESPIAIVQPVEVDESAHIAAQRIAESLKINQARIAADSNDLCPKLISMKVDTNIIERKGEVLKSEYCDYYVYPVKGQKISVESEPDIVSAYLVSPVKHDFKNGSYTVNKSDKYIIRLDYTGIEYRNNPINYDVVVTIE